jgi:hypothetical protein
MQLVQTLVCDTEDDDFVKMETVMTIFGIKNTHWNLVGVHCECY